MGITIHYKGKAKSREAIDDLIDTLAYIATERKWKYRLVHEKVQGMYRPSWGYGYGYIPALEDRGKEGIEFFPKMISEDCNGYFRIFDTPYAETVRHAFTEGRQPQFHIDTSMRGISLDLHPQCESLEFIFDLKTLELANYQTSQDRPRVVLGYNGFFCKTQFAGFDTHITVCKIIKMTERYIDYSSIDDEAGFYYQQDTAKAQKEFDDMAERIESMRKTLSALGKKHGFNVVTGEEL